MTRDLRLRLPEEELRRLYSNEKKSLEDIARIYGVSRVAVFKYCRAKELSRRTKSEARLEAQKKGKVPQDYFEINENFFSKWSPEMAYVFGLLITDGCLSRVKKGSYRISLCLNDKDLLERVAKTMSSEHPISPSRHQEGLYLFMFGREKLAQDLLKLGMKPRKSTNIGFPDVPGEYMNDFIRGVFDGDGSVFFDKRSVNYPIRSKFHSASRDFIEKLEMSLQMLGLPKRNIYGQKKKNSTLYMFKYGHKDSAKLFKILYKNTLKNGLYLRRKYYKFLSGLKN